VISFLLSLSVRVSRPAIWVVRHPTAHFGGSNNYYLALRRLKNMRVPSSVVRVIILPCTFF
jgi:hypothetical protein